MVVGSFSALIAVNKARTVDPKDGLAAGQGGRFKSASRTISRWLIGVGTSAVSGHFNPCIDPSGTMSPARGRAALIA